MDAPRDPRSGTLRESATVMLLRDGARGLEVYMVRRKLKGDFIGGAYVFPGGVLDAGDAHPEVASRLASGGLDAAALGRALELAPERALAHVSAALRETFEEAGVLLARGPGGPLDLREPGERARWDALRHRLIDSDLDWAALCAGEDLLLDGEALAYHAFWITPEGEHRRYATRFFLARAPEHQAPLVDAKEVTLGEWLRPLEALERRARGEMAMIFPTVRTLEELAESESVEAAFARARARRVTPRLPRAVEQDGRVRILLPGEPGYAEAALRPAPSFDPWALG